MKRWALDTWLNIDNKYTNIIYTAATLSPKNAERYLINKNVTFSFSPSDITLPDMQANKEGIKIMLSGESTRRIFIGWHEVYLYCMKRFKELGLDEKTKHL